MRSPRTRSRLLIVSALSAALLAAPAAASAASAGAPPASYILKKATSRCRAHYRRTTVTIRRRRHGRRIKVHVVRCVLMTSGESPAASPQSAAPTFPSDLPVATVQVSVLPTVSGHSYSTAAGETLSVGGSGLLADATGTRLSAVLVSGPPRGSLTLNSDGTFSYTPASGSSGIEHFVYKATSSSGESSTPASVTIKVAPIAVDSVFTVTANGALQIPAGGLLAGAVGTGLSATLVSGPADGQLSLGADGSATYTPAEDFSGSDSFSYEVVDGSSLASNAATVTLNVAALPPTVVDQSYSGAIGNTALQVGSSRAAGPEVYIGSTNALAGDGDPNGGTLSVSPGAIGTADGGTVTIASDGEFTYVPPAGFTGPTDSFSYVVDESEGVSAVAYATIHFTGARIWYVDDAAPAGGNGTSAAPFNSLAPVSAGAGNAGPADVIYVAGGNASYGGGITLGPGETLLGSGAALASGGVTLTGPRTAPVITNGSGAGITLADGDTVSGLAVQGTQGDGISANGVDSFTLAASVSVSGAGADGLDVEAGGGTIADAAAISNSTGPSIAIQDRSGGAVSVSGALSGSGGVLVANDAAGASINFSGPIALSTGAQPAFSATGGGSVTVTSAGATLATTTARALEVSGGSTIGSQGLTFLSISAGTGSGGPDHGILVDTPSGGGGLLVLGGGLAGTGGTIENTSGDAVSLSNVAAVELESIDITNAGADGIDLTGDGTVAQAFDIESNQISGQPGAAIAVDVDGSNSARALGVVSNNTVSGSSAGDGIDIYAGDSASLTVKTSLNTITGVGAGIDAQSHNGATLELTLQSNSVTITGSGSRDGVDVSESGTPGFVCVDPTLNALGASAAGSHDIALAQQAATGTFEIDGGYDGVSSVPAFLNTNNALANGVAGASATTAGNPFTAGSCTAIGSHPV